MSSPAWISSIILQATDNDVRKLQYDHLLPKSRGGMTMMENPPLGIWPCQTPVGLWVVTCGPCNFGRGEKTLEEVGLMDPRTMPAHDRRGMEAWDGLERFR